MNKKKQVKTGIKKGGGWCDKEVCAALKSFAPHATLTEREGPIFRKYCNQESKPTSWIPRVPKLSNPLSSMSSSLRSIGEKINPSKIFTPSEEKSKKLVIQQAIVELMNNVHDLKNIAPFLNKIIDLFKDKDKDIDKILPDVLHDTAEVSDTSIALILYKYEICRGEKKLTPEYKAKLQEYETLIKSGDGGRGDENAHTGPRFSFSPSIEYLCEGEDITHIYLPVIKVNNNKYIDLLKHSHLADKPISASNLIKKSSFEGDQIVFKGSAYHPSFPFPYETWNEEDTIRLKRVESLTYDISTQEKLDQLMPGLNTEHEPDKGTVAVGGKKHSKKEILGKSRCIYKIKGDRKEYVKHKGKLITIKDYKAIIKAKAKKPKKQPKRRVQKKST